MVSGVKVSQIPNEPSLKSKLSVEDAERLLNAERSFTPESRSAAMSAYVVLAKRRPAQARKLFRSHIDWLIEQKKDVSSEIWRYYLVETKQSARQDAVDFYEVAKTKADAIKWIILEAMPFFQQKLAPDIIIILVESLNSDQAREMAINFWMRPDPSNLETRAMLMVLTEMVSPSPSLIEKICACISDVKAVEREIRCVQKRFPEFASNKRDLNQLLEENDWTALNSIVFDHQKDCGRILKAAHSRLAQAEISEIEEIAKLCQTLATIATNDSFKKALSNTLFNTGRRLRPIPTFIDAWATSIRLEMGTSERATLLEKTTRFIVALLETDTVCPVIDEALVSLAEILEKDAKDWAPLAKALNKLAAAGRLPGSWEALEVVLMLSTKETAPRVFQELCVTGPSDRRGHWIALYKSVMGLDAILPDTMSLDTESSHVPPDNVPPDNVPSDNVPSNNVSPTVQANVSAYTVQERYRRCELGLEDAWYAVLQGFLEFIPRLSETEVELFDLVSTPKPHMLQSQIKKYSGSLEKLIYKWAVIELLLVKKDFKASLPAMLQAISAAWALVRKYGGAGPVTVLMDLCVRTSQLYAFLGNAKDAFMYMKAAYKQAVRSDSPVRQAAYAQMLNSISLILGEKNSLVPPEVPHEFVSQLLKHYKEFDSEPTKFQKAQEEYTRSLKVLSKNAILDLIPECALSIPSLSVDTKVPEVAESLHDLLSRLLNVEPPLCWSQATQLAKIVRDVSTTLSAVSSVELQPLVEKLEAPKYSYVRLCRAFQTELPAQNLDTRGHIVICLNFENDSQLVVSRIDDQALHVTLPLERNENEEFLTLNDALTQLSELTALCLSDDGLHKADGSDISPEERRAYWTKRGQAEKQFEQFLNRIEQDWFRGFRGLLSPFIYDTGNLSDALTTMLWRYFKKSLTIPPEIVQLIAGAGSNMTIEEAEDLIYFITDSFRFHGFDLDYDELDFLDMAKALRREVRQFHSVSEGTKREIVLIPNVGGQNFPWEALPMLRGVSVGRFLSLEMFYEAVTRSNVEATNPGSVYYVLNPEDNLKRLEADFEADFRLRGWQGIAGHTPDESALLGALESHHWYLYMGHGAGQICAKPHRIQKLQKCANVILMGCSSARTRGGNLGFDGYGPHTDYAMAGCNLLIGNLWDVADRDINRFCKEFLSRVFDHQQTVGQALAEAREACVLRYCTGAAPIIYGLPSATAQ